jgi:1,4-alpha-glucan branching enzyme
VLARSQERLRAATAAWLLAPATPMLVMGEEFAATTPFLFFCDFSSPLAEAVTEGRRREFGEFGVKAGEPLPDPNHPDTFERSKLDWLSLERPEHASSLELYKRLLALRREHVTPRLAGIEGRSGDYDVLGQAALSVRWKLGDKSTLELRLNLSSESTRTTAPEGELIHAEPAEAAQAFGRGELPGDSAAIYLTRARQ